MFTGIVTDVGRVVGMERGGQAWSVTIACALPRERLQVGDSIACSGACLTIAESGAADGGGWFRVEISEETRRCTSLAAWEEGRRVNLEPALLASSPLGGHFMSGHVDGTSRILSMEEVEGCRRVWLDAPADCADCIAPKGSVGLDGVSLTVNEIRDGEGAAFAFRVELIPHTLAHTCWGEAQVGERLNLEVDLIARYVARLLGRGKE